MHAVYLYTCTTGGHGGWGKPGEELDVNEEDFYDEEELAIQRAEEEFVASATEEPTPVQ